MGLSIRGYAKHRGVTEGAVRYALKSGRITRGSDGKIDPIKADNSWEDNTNHAKRHRGAFADMATDEATSTPPVQNTPAKHSSIATYQQAKALDMVNKAKIGRMQLEELEKKLIDREKALKTVFSLARQFRDSWTQWPARISSQLAAETGADPHKLHLGLEKYVREQLEATADISTKLE